MNSKRVSVRFVILATFLPFAFTVNLTPKEIVSQAVNSLKNQLEDELNSTYTNEGSCPQKALSSFHSDVSDDLQRLSLQSRLYEMVVRFVNANESEDFDVEGGVQSRRPRRQAVPSKLVFGKSIFQTDKELENYLESALDNLMKDFRAGKPHSNRFTLDPVTLFRPNSFKISPQDVTVSQDDNPSLCDEKSLNIACTTTLTYRTLNGRCNSLAIASQSRAIPSEEFGRSNIKLERILPSEYDDGISKPRVRSKLGGLLPSPRQVSLGVHASRVGASHLHSRHSLALMQWGQYLDHDITSTPMVVASNGDLLNCSDCNKRRAECDPIPLQTNDPLRTLGGRNCIPFTRSVAGQASFEPREQINQVTAFIDASSVYGSDICRVRDLRNGTMLKSLSHPISPAIFKGLLPMRSHKECVSPTKKCFYAGDDRSTEQPGLSCIHTVFQREHNRLAQKLSMINPEWNNDTVFQEARKIISALHQHITYKEFLPRVLGPRLMDFFKLNLKPSFDDTYNSYCSPNIFNEFATAAFRFGHSLIRADFTLMKNKTERTQIRLRDHFNNPEVVMNNAYFIDELLNGLVSKPMSINDEKLTEELTNHLFEEKGKPFSGMDLAALNIHRGRDHGIPAFTKYVKWCSKLLGTSYEVRDFRDLEKIMDIEKIELIERVYKHVDDVDLFTGGLSERPLPGGLVGQTFGCIIGLQFQRIKNCDRFWYERDDKLIGFTEQQLAELKNETFSSVLCRNSDVPTAIQRMAFDLESKEDNPLIDCAMYSDLDLMHWKVGKKGRNSDAAQPPFCDLKGRIVPIQKTVRISACTECTCIDPSGIDNSCKSVYIPSCENLLQEVGIEALESDQACKTQCPKLFKLP